MMVDAWKPITFFFTEHGLDPGNVGEGCGRLRERAHVRPMRATLPPVCAREALGTGGFSCPVETISGMFVRRTSGRTRSP